jgi:methylmalonic aciduria homocystinuria type C protein
MGVCLHPKFGGWFAMRSVFIISNVSIDVSNLREIRAEDHLNGDIDRVIDLLKRFNFSWRDGTYRDVIPVAEKYSKIQQEYFNLEPRLRKDLIREWLLYPNPKILCSIYERNSAEELKRKSYLLKNFYFE